MDDDEFNLPEDAELDLAGAGLDDEDTDLDDEEEDPLLMEGFHEVEGLEPETDF